MYTATTLIHTNTPEVIMTDIDAYDAACFDAADDTNYNELLSAAVVAPPRNRAYVWDAAVHFPCDPCGAPVHHRCKLGCREA